MFKLLTWNIRHGGGPRRTPEICLALLGHGADVIVLTEFRRTTGGQIAGVLADHGWVHQRSSDPPPGSNGILIASRSALEVRPDNTAETADLRRRWLDVELPDLGMSLTGVHVPDARAGAHDARARKSMFWHQILDAARARAGKPCVFVGDFNTGRHRIDEVARTFTCTPLLGAFATMGYRDAWRLRNPAGREYSWFSHKGSGFRLDQAFLSPAMQGRLRSSWYSHTEREGGLSDHSVLLLGLDFPGVDGGG